jgi:retron-type reverse transcriptase
MKVGNSITPQGEKLTNLQLQDQWNNIDWKKVENQVYRLQVRITKAVKEGKWYLVKRLQYLLTHSYYAKLLATRNLTQNKGKRTAGIDGEIWSSPESWNMLWHWAKRRHPNKSNHWTARKYWHSSGKRNWVFSEGNKQLNLLSDKKIVRHTKLKLDMNPYLDKDYFILRRIKLGIKKLKDTTNKMWNKVNKDLQPETKTITNNCCPI